MVDRDSGADDAADPVWPRVVVHADMDAFYAAVEQLRRPELRGRPVIVGGTSRRGVVSTASYEARPFGVHSAMPMERARRLCPDAVILPPDFEAYRSMSGRIMAVFSGYSPRVEPLSLDEAFLDMSGARRLFGPPEAIGRAIQRDVARATGGLTVSVGISCTKYVAKVASDFRKPAGLTIVPAPEVRAFLEPLDISRLWGVGPKTAARLAALGFRRVGDVARAAPERLARELGEVGDHLARLARGEDPREVEVERAARSVGAEVTLERDVRGARRIGPHLRRAAERVAARLRGERLLAGGVRVKLKTARFRLLTRQMPLETPTDDAAELLAAANALLPEFDLTQPMRLVGIAAFRLEAAETGRQGELFVDAGRERRRRLDRALDTLRERFGDEAVRRGEDEEDADT